MKISVNTKTLGIFGYPIGHSLSPLMQNAAIEAAGVNAVYLPFEVRPSRLRQAVDGIRGAGFLGVNITIPHKEAVMGLLDEISTEAVAIGAVNTIVNKNGRLIGYNTDGNGYLSSLKEDSSFNPKGKRILVIGAGGAAKGVIYAIAKESPKTIVIANRTLERAEALAAKLKRRFNNLEVIPIELYSTIFTNHLEETDLLVNTTSLGMKGKGTLDIPIDRLPAHATVSDILYVPLKTKLLFDAEKRALKTHNGLGMLIHQGAIGFSLWTGIAAPKDIMRKALEEALA
jgi:shikimate dehydrogenase